MTIKCRGIKMSSDLTNMEKVDDTDKREHLGIGGSEIILDAVGDKKINVIKVIRTYTGLGLMEAKELTDYVPSTIINNISFQGANIIKEELELAGATVSIRGVDGVRIKELLIEQEKKLPVSDIAAFLKYKDIDSVKHTCESMFHADEISYAGNGRYFVLTEGADEKKKTKPEKTEKAEAEDIERALEKYKSMLDKGLITEEQYQAKTNELLGL